VADADVIASSFEGVKPGRTLRLAWLVVRLHKSPGKE
jgi:hypothetical protein